MPAIVPTKTSGVPLRDFVPTDQRSSCCSEGGVMGFSDETPVSGWVQSSMLDNL